MDENAVDQDPVDQDPVDQDAVDQDAVDQDAVDQDAVDQDAVDGSAGDSGPDTDTSPDEPMLTRSEHMAPDEAVAPEGVSGDDASGDDASGDDASGDRTVQAFDEDENSSLTLLERLDRRQTGILSELDQLSQNIEHLIAEIQHDRQQARRAA